jgi:hypothetical protein
LRAFLKGSTLSATSGFQIYLVTSSGAANYSGLYGRQGLNSAPTYFDTSSSFIVAALADAPTTLGYGETAPEIIIDVPSSVTIAPQIYDRTLADTVNQPMLMTNSWVEIRRIK